MGVQIQGDTGNVIATKGTYSGNVTIGGTLTYEDVTNIDSVGLITARQGIEVGASPGVGASISVDGNAIFSGITTATTLRAPTGIVTSLITNTARATTGIVTTLTATTGIVTTLTTNTLTANSTAKVGSGVTLSPDGDVFATGVCTATSFSGSGANLTGISAGLFSSYAVVTDEKSNGTDGGDFNSGAWRQRDLNTEKLDPDGIVSVSSNEFSLGTGTYYIEAFAPAYGVGRHMVKIYSVSSPSQDWYGESAFAHASHYATTHSFVRARITCSGTRNLAIAHQCETSRSSTGMGIASNFGNVETYTVVKIYKES